MFDLSRGTIVVTGGAGFIGSAVVWALNVRGIDDILVVDRLDATEKWKNLVPLRFADFVDADDFIERLRNHPGSYDTVSTVIHLGACSSTMETDAAYLLRNNYEYTKQLAHWSVDRGIRFTYASSAATYGALEDTLSEDRPLATLRPLNAYAYSKQLFDLSAQRTGLLDGITGIKYFNIFGPNEQHKAEMRSLVDKAFHQIRETGSVRLFRSYRAEYRDGEQERDFLYVKDAVDMTLHLTQRQAYGIYNVGSGEAHTWLDLVRPIFRAMNAPERIDFVEMPAVLREKYQYHTRASLARLRSTGYDRAVTPLANAVDDYVRNYLLPDRRLDPSQALAAAAVK